MLQFRFGRGPRLFMMATWAMVSVLPLACADDAGDTTDAGDANAPRPDASSDDAVDASDTSETGQPRSDAPALDMAIETNADRIADVTSEDAAMCECQSDDAQFSRGTVALPCLCATTSMCRSFDDAARCDASNSSLWSIETYRDCNFVQIRLESPLFARRYVYSGTTHELLGLYAADDASSFACGSSRVMQLQAGPDPIANGCHVEKREGCDLDAARPDADAPSDSDAGCACTPDDAGFKGEMSFPCFCSTTLVCPSYDIAVGTCPSSNFPGGNKLEIHGDCNLTVITTYEGFGYRKFVYETTTQVLVGAERASDTNELSCGSTRVFGYRAGTFPPPSCAVTQTIPRCQDGGDAATDAVDGSVD